MAALVSVVSTGTDEPLERVASYWYELCARLGWVNLPDMLASVST